MKDVILYYAVPLQMSVFVVGEESFSVAVFYPLGDAIWNYRYENIETKDIPIKMDRIREKIEAKPKTASYWKQHLK